MRVDDDVLGDGDAVGAVIDEVVVVGFIVLCVAVGAVVLGDMVLGVDIGGLMVELVPGIRSSVVMPGIVLGDAGGCGAVLVPGLVVAGGVVDGVAGAMVCAVAAVARPAAKSVAMNVARMISLPDS